MKKLFILGLGMLVLCGCTAVNNDQRSREIKVDLTEEKSAVESKETSHQAEEVRETGEVETKDTYEYDEERKRYLIWQDEFEGDEIDSTVWSIPTGGLRNNELQYYTKDQIQLKDGVAVILAERDDTYEGFSWVSGEMELNGKQAFNNCLIESRIRMQTEKGFCPAFWTLGDTINGWNWAKCGEIDMVETPSPTTVNTNTHAVDDEGNHFAFGTNQKTDVDLSEWHVYGLELENGVITILLDNEVISTVDTNQYSFYDGVNPFLQCQFPIFNLAVGGTASYGNPAEDIDEASMEIDYVRVYSLEGESLENIVPVSYEMKYIGSGRVIEEYSLAVGDKLQLFPVYEPRTSVGGSIVSSRVYDEAICSCNCGYVEALSPGETTIEFTDSNGLMSTIEIKVVESMASSSINGCNIVDVDLNDVSIWKSGFYGNSGELKEDPSRAYTDGFAIIEPNATYTKVFNNAPAVLVTVFDKDYHFLKTYDSTITEFTTPENAAYCIVSIKFVDGALKADHLSRILELIPNYPFSIEKK